MTRNNRAVGSIYEEKIAAFLKQNGFVILERNYRCRQGEVDLICTQGPCLVFVEVKYRTDGRMGGPLEAVDKRKQRRIRQAAAHYMYSHGFAEDCACRFDVVGILGERIELVQDAF